MTTSEKVISVIIAVAIIIFSISFFREGKSLQVGSVAQSHEYQSTSTSATIQDLVVLKNGAGALGSVVITLTGTAPFTLYDATSTVNNAEWATTTLASFPASPTVGTYTFDVNFRKGLLIDYGTGSLATSTITWR